jgi:hypothetical protein
VSRAEARGPNCEINFESRQCSSWEHKNPVQIGSTLTAPGSAILPMNLLGRAGTEISPGRFAAVDAWHIAALPVPQNEATPGEKVGTVPSGELHLAS